MEIVIDFSIFENMTPIESWWYMIAHGGWILILWALLKGGWEYWKFWSSNRWAATVPYVLLAIDVPKMNEQAPLAVENIFSQLAGSHGTETKWEKYGKGQFQLSFSFEIVSIDGYVQFIIHTPEKQRDLVEAAIYAQYPDAEIHEIEDYVKGVPQRWPHPEWDFFGLENKLSKPECYPVRMWREFEDKLSGEFKDPMAALLEVMGSLNPGEQAWVQWVITPIDDKWKDAGERVIDKLIKRKSPLKESKIVKILNIPLTILGMIASAFVGAEEEGVKKKDDPYSIMLSLSPGQKKVVEMIENKLSKIGYRTKSRVMYFGRKEVFHRARGAGGIVGALKQFNTVDGNRWAVQKHIWTKVYYVFTKYRLKTRQNKLMKAYKFRSTTRGAGLGFVLNIEELATVWHFPVMQVKAPLVKKTEAKRAEPPFTLPVAVPRVFHERPKVVPPPLESPEVVPYVDKEPEPVTQEEKPAETASEHQLDQGAPPSNLPFV